LINQTLQEYNRVIKACKDIFIKKTQDYGTAWRILRLPSITDQIFIKAQRIRSIQEKGVQKVPEDIRSEFVGIVNYCVIALMQLQLSDQDAKEIPAATVAQWYDREIQANIDLLLNKNHDYGEAWRDMRISSITDIILMKLYRTKQIEDNQGQTLISEGVEANYRDMINYAVFVLIKLNLGLDEAH
jgi:Nucleotide modification associated domain 1